MKTKALLFVILMLALAAMLTACAAPEADNITELPAAAEDVSGIVAEADALFEEGKFSESMERYLEAMEKNIRDVDARLGVAKCQVEMENYAVAIVNISMIRELAPDRIEICDLYLRMAEKSGESRYARTAVEIAEEYGHDTIMEKIPVAPSFSHEAGAYSERIVMEISHPDPDAKIYLTLHNDTNSYFYFYDTVYHYPIKLVRGLNTVEAYVVKNGIPSEMAVVEYNIDYPCEEVSFAEPLIEKIARNILGKYDGPITNYDCEEMDHLDWYSLMDENMNYNKLMSMRVDTIEDLQYFPVITYLNLQYQDKVKDFSPLTYCPMLYQIELNGCRFTNTDIIRYVPYAVYIGLNDNELTDISALLERNDIWGLSVQRNKNLVVDEIVRNNKELYYLDIDDTQLEDYSVLTELEQLERLQIYGVSNIDYEVLGELTSLVDLDISYNYERFDYRNSIDDLSFLPKLQKLEFLYLNGVNDPADLDYIAQLPNLTNLYLYECDATEDQEAMEALKMALPNCSIYY